jgi:putative DNA primase/helicase
MPLRPAAKVPVLSAWQALCGQMPTEEQQQAWLEAYPEGNMGLPLGPQAGIIGLDLDSEDPRVQEILDRIMPISPWKRVGKKGAVYAFKYSGERTYRIKDKDNNTILEILSKGAQIVLPPSIHPDTMQPYVANCHLSEVVDRLPALPADFENKVRQALIDAGFELSSRGTTKVAEWVPAGGRDSAMTSMAGLLARGVLRKERTLLEALNEIDTWVATFTQKVVGDEMDPEKARKKVLEFLRRDIVEGRKQLPTGWDAGLKPNEIEQVREYMGEDSEEWDLDKILAYVMIHFDQTPQINTPARQEIVENVLVRLARSQQLTSLDHEVVLSAIQRASSQQITLTALRKRLKELTQPSHFSSEDHTGIAKALIKELERVGPVRLQQGQVHQWKGSHWSPLEDADICGLLAREFGWCKGAKRNSDHKGILEVLKRLIPRAPEARQGINFANGFLTPDLELLPHAEGHGATYVLPYRWTSTPRPPVLLHSFLDQCWGPDPDYEAKCQALREAIAATMFRCAHTYQRAFCLYGAARSGKSTAMEVIFGLLPPGTTSHVPPQDWGDRFLPAQMAGKIANSCGELSERTPIPGDLFKQIVDGTTITAQHKHQPPFKFQPTCAQWFAGNHLPKTADTSEGFNRRWLILHFPRQVPADQVRVELAKEILGDECEAIVAWALPAITELSKRRCYTLPTSHGQLVSDMASQTNPVRHFLASGAVVIDEHDHSGVSEEDLYRAYYVFFRLNHGVSGTRRPLDPLGFRSALADLQPEFGFRTAKRMHHGREVSMFLNVRKAA